MRSRRPDPRLNRGRIATTAGDPGPSLNAPTLAIQEGGLDVTTADEGDDLAAAVTVDDGDGGTTSDVVLWLNGASLGSMTDDGGGAWSMALADVLPGTHSYVARRVTDLGNRDSAAWEGTVAPATPSLDAPLDEDSVTIGDPLDFEATGSADGFDANTDQIAFYVNAVLRATASSDVAGVWGASWDTTGATPAANQSVIARRSWVGVSGQTGTVDSVDAVYIDLVSGAVAPTLVSAIINAAGTSLTLTYSEALDTGSVPALLDFSLSGPALAVLTGTPNVTGSTVVLTLAPAVMIGEAGITISYTAGVNPIQDLTGDDAANLVNQAVTNNSTHTFVPSDIAGLVFWLDMQDTGNYTESGGVVTTFNNKASATAWPEATNPAAYSATGLSGSPCMDFDGSNDRYINTEAAVLAALTNNPAYTVFYAGLHDTVDRGDAVFGVGNSGVATNRTRLWGQTTDGAGRWGTISRNDAGTAVTCISAGGSDANPHIFYWHGPGTTCSLQVDNAAASPNGTACDPGTLTPDRCAVGCRPDSAPDTFFDGKLGELLIYSADITGANYTLIYDYLNAKWPP